MMWSSVPNVRAGMRTFSFSSLSIWKACGVVTSWMRCRPIRSWVWPDGSVRTVCASHTLSSSVRAMEILREGYRAPSSPASPPLDAPRRLTEYRGDELRQPPRGVKGWTSWARWGTIPFSEDFHGTHAARQGVGRAHGPDAAVRPDPAPDRPPPDPRGDDAAGLPDAEGAEAQGAHARADVRHARSHHPDG